MKSVFEDFSMHKTMSEYPLIFDYDDDNSVFSNFSNYAVQIDGKMYPSVKSYLDSDLMKVDKYLAVKTKFFHSYNTTVIVLSYFFTEISYYQ